MLLCSRDCFCIREKKEEKNSHCFPQRCYYSLVIYKFTIKKLISQEGLSAKGIKPFQILSDLVELAESLTKSTEEPNSNPRPSLMSKLAKPLLLLLPSSQWGVVVAFAATALRGLVV